MTTTTTKSAVFTMRLKEPSVPKAMLQRSRKWTTHVRWTEHLLLSLLKWKTKYLRNKWCKQFLVYLGTRFCPKLVFYYASKSLIFRQWITLWELQSQNRLTTQTWGNGGFYDDIYRKSHAESPYSVCKWIGHSKRVWFYMLILKKN